MLQSVVSFICVILFTYAGVAVRLWLSSLSDHLPDLLPGQLGSSFFLSNIVGSMVMGVMARIIQLYPCRPHWSLGVMSGFCGCCTTFASWHKTTAGLVLNGRVLDSLLISFTTFTTSYSALVCGRHLADGLLAAVGPIFPQRRAEQERADRKDSQSAGLIRAELVVGSIVLVAITGALWTAVFVDPSWTRRHWWIALAFGPFGSSIRYASSLYNSKLPRFPLFTFMVNVAASVLAVALMVGEKYVDDRRGLYELWGVQGVGVGLCGSLSTVSTLVNELYKLSVVDSHRYGWATFIVSQVLCLMVGCAAITVRTTPWAM